MKHIFFFTCLAVAGHLSAQWQVVGTRKFSAGATGSVSTAVNSQGTPYVAFKDASLGNKAVVMKYNGANWVNVGTAGFSSGTANSLHFAISRKDTAYVVYSDASLSNNLVVKKFDGSNWVNAGTISTISTKTDISLDTSGVPYVAYLNNTSNADVYVKKNL